MAGWSDVVAHWIPKPRPHGPLDRWTVRSGGDGGGGGDPRRLRPSNDYQLRPRESSHPKTSTFRPRKMIDNRRSTALPHRPSCDHRSTRQLGGTMHRIIGRIAAVSAMALGGGALYLHATVKATT